MVSDISIKVETTEKCKNNPNIYSYSDIPYIY